MKDRSPLHATIDISETMSIFIEEVARLAAEEAVAMYAKRIESSSEPVDRLLTLEEAAHRCRCSKQTLSKWRKEGLIETVYVGGTTPHIKASEVERFLGFEGQ